MSSVEESDLVYLGRRLDKALTYIKENEPDLVEEFLNSVGIGFEKLITSDLSPEEEDVFFDGIDQALDYLEGSYGTVFEQSLPTPS